jgi:hypothetical protein
MLSIEECQKHLEGLDMTDEEVENLRDRLYKMIRPIIKNEREV